MGFLNRVTGMFKRQQKTAAAVIAAAPPEPSKADLLRAKIDDYYKRARFTPVGYLSATHRTSHRTVSMDLRDAKKRRNIEKRKGR